METKHFKKGLPLGTDWNLGLIKGFCSCTTLGYGTLNCRTLVIFQHLRWTRSKLTVLSCPPLEKWIWSIVKLWYFASNQGFSPSLISCHLLALALWDGITIRLSSVGVSVRHLCQWVVQDGFIIFSEVLNDSTPGIHSWSRVPETPQATVSFKCWLQHMCQLPVYGDRCWNFQMFKCKLQHTNKFLSK